MIAFWPGGGDPNPGNPIGGAQAAMDSAFDYVFQNAPFTITGTYTIAGVSGSGAVTTIPAPASALALLGLGALTARRRR